MPTRPAIVVRVVVRKKGANSCTAMRVAGKEPKKIATPTNPLNLPFALLSFVL
jgi:hypothetical protein